MVRVLAVLLLVLLLLLTDGISNASRPSPVAARSEAPVEQAAPLDRSQIGGPAASPDEAFAGYVREELTSRPFVGSCREAREGRDAGTYCATEPQQHRGLWAYGVVIFQADGGLYVFVTEVGTGWMVVAVAGIGVEDTGIPWPWPDEEALSVSEALTTLVATVPDDADSFMVRLFPLGDRSFAWLSYERTEPVAVVFPPGPPAPLPRRYDSIARWDGQAWQEQIASYATALAVFGPDAIGRVLGGQPEPNAALVDLRVFPLGRPVAERGEMPDLIAAEIRYREGPTGLPQPSPTLLVLVPTAGGLDIGARTDFEVRGRLRYVTRFAGEILAAAPASVGGDPRCCPSGSELVRLTWRNGRLTQVERCIRPGEQVFSCR